jgi:hypothetical protein
VQRVGAQLVRESNSDLLPSLRAAFVRLTQEATTRHNYGAVAESISALQQMENVAPGLAIDIRPRVAVENRFREFVREARHSDASPDLVEVLRGNPRAAAEEITCQFGACTSREDRERLVELANAMGPSLTRHLIEMLSTRSAPEAVNTVGLLSRVYLPALAAELPLRLPGWSRIHQDSVVRQIACGGSAERGQLLMLLLESLDPVLLPEAVEEIGISGFRLASGKLLGFVRDESAAAFLKLKSIEALGRLRDLSAESTMMDILTTRRLGRWRYARELRIAAAQALLRINPERGEMLVPVMGLSPLELSVAPSDISEHNGWIRARRYPRVSPARSFRAQATHARGKSVLSLESLSLGGGLGTVSGRPVAAGEARLDMRIGLRHLRSHVLLREFRPRQYSFEFLDMDLGDRNRLRHLISEHLPQTAA